MLVIVAVIVMFITMTLGFNVNNNNNLVRRRNVLSMEYIPEGFTKAQWQLLKAKEAEELKLKKMGALGSTKFKSRSFEAWQKSGGKHLFPVDPNTTPYEERPYMQRKNGDWEGKDLKGKGLFGVGQGQASQRLKVDDIYEDDVKKGKKNSISIFGGAPLPWTSEATDKIGKLSPEELQKRNQRASAAKKLSPQEMERLKKSLIKPVVTKKETTIAASTEAPKKRFGFF